MGALPEAAAGRRSGFPRGIGVVIGLVLALGAVDLHDPNLHPVVYATPTPVLPGTECEDRCEHLEAGCLLTPDHQPATRPGGKVRLAFSRVCASASPEAVDRHPASYTSAPPGPPSVRPDSARSPPVG